MSVSKSRRMKLCIFFQLAIYANALGAADRRLVFGAGEAGVACFRIPSLVSGSTPGALIAIAEARLANCNDETFKQIATKTSLDNGQTWSNLKLVGSTSDELFNPEAVLVHAPAGRGNTGSPAFVIVQYLANRTLCAVRSCSVMQITTVDNGESWSDPVSIQRFLSPFVGGLRPGPGRGIQLRAPNSPHQGRIVMSGSYSILDIAPPGSPPPAIGSGRASGPPSDEHPEAWQQSHLIKNPATDEPGIRTGKAMNRAGGISNISAGGNHTDIVWYSDDLGKSWQVSSARLQGVDESSLAELSDGSIFISLRLTADLKNKPCNCRAYARSQDGGVTWGPIEFSTDLPASECEGAVAAPTEGAGAGKLYFSNPSNALVRENMTVHSSFDGGKSWPRAIVVDPGPAAYSSLLPLLGDEVDTLGLLYEHGGTGCPTPLYGNITFVKVPAVFWE